ncbi:MAG: hypothetical protein Q3965_02360 [Rothia sp. (in: high G+C Gram-positive bacteria)]|nr:hypothetical protein [Rothia sp. (in: high G+C Gram-positive bacteria)]
MTEGNYGNQPNQQQPPSYSAVHPGGAYASYAQAYGQGLPQHMEKPAPPKSLKIAAVLTYIIVGINLLYEVLGIIFIDEILNSMSDRMGDFLTSADASDMEVLKQQMESSSTLPSMIIDAGVQVVISAAVVAFAICMVKGHNWARIVLTIYASFIVLVGVFVPFGFILVFHWTMLLSIVAALVAIAALIFYWLPAGNEFMRSMRAYKMWEQQRAYWGAR